MFLNHKSFRSLSFSWSLSFFPYIGNEQQRTLSKCTNRTLTQILKITLNLVLNCFFYDISTLSLSFFLSLALTLRIWYIVNLLNARREREISSFDIAMAFTRTFKQFVDLYTFWNSSFALQITFRVNIFKYFFSSLRWNILLGLSTKQ